MTSRPAGFGLVEMMLAMALGLIISAGVFVIFLAQRQVYSTTTSQALVQDADNAISAIVTPAIRGSGFMGCGAISNGVHSYLTSRTTPLTFDTSSGIQGYTGTLPASIVDGSANDVSKGDWAPALDASFVTAGGVTKGSDVLTLIGATSGSVPTATKQDVTASAPISIVDSTQGPLTSGAQILALSDCNKSVVFQATGVTGNVVSYTTGPNGIPTFLAGAQLAPVQQTAFFIAKGHAGQSALFEGVMTLGSTGAANAFWTVNEIVPGVSGMKVLYGITNGNVTQYVDANGVAAAGGWSLVTVVKLGFLVEGNQGSASKLTAPTLYSLFNSSLSVPADSRLRHVFYMTVNTRNTTL
ncbi:PilW family protein [Dyella silvatica]|uniref:PilW family protein n=1 Tax=Dyella silvatica TaxID=2992128 RepID=UPI002259E89E|nr:PilW family protein [Dyella silvatica]